MIFPHGPIYSAQLDFPEFTPIKSKYYRRRRTGGIRRGRERNQEREASERLARRRLRAGACARGAPIRCAAAPRAADWLPLLRRSPVAFKCMPRWLFSPRWPAYTIKHAQMASRPAAGVRWVYRRARKCNCLAAPRACSPPPCPMRRLKSPASRCVACSLLRLERTADNPSYPPMRRC